MLEAEESQVLVPCVVGEEHQAELHIAKDMFIYHTWRVLHSIALSSLEAISIRLSGPFGLIG
jgi:hypothetical protein